MFELTVSLMGHGQLPKFQAISKFPSVRRDLAVIVPESLPVAQLNEIIQGQLDNTLQEIKVFDVYRGEGVDTGCKSIALGVILQHNERTLTDEEVDQMMARAISALHEQCGASLRA